MITLPEFSRRLARVRSRRRQRIDATLQQRLDDHVVRMRNAISELSERMSPDDAFCVISSAGNESSDYREALDAAADSDGFVWVRNTALLGISSCYGWIHDPETDDIANPWEPFLDLLLAGVGISYSYDDENGEYKVLMRLKTEVSDETIVLYSAPNDIDA